MHLGVTAQCFVSVAVQSGEKVLTLAFNQTTSYAKVIVVLLSIVYIKGLKLAARADILWPPT